ncbi:MAG: MotA/TolQ/ExbB proton channel family protein [Legionellales bacterium]|jgi:biopolymer transport protein ExbB
MLLELLNSSWVMYPLFAASILALAIILERLCILNFSLKGAKQRVLIKQSKEAMLNQAKQEIFLWEKHLNMLGTIATTTPLLGLLGTVLGMITIFDVMMQEGLGQAQSLAGGISEALLTTAVGMSIAIITLLFHRYFNRKINGLILQLETAMMESSEYA